MKKLLSMGMISIALSVSLYAEDAPANGMMGNMMGSMQNMMQTGMNAMQTAQTGMNTVQDGMNTVKNVQNGQMSAKDAMMNTVSEHTGMINLDMVNKMPQDMQLKLKYDHTVTMPILMRASMKHADNAELKLTAEQKSAIAKHKAEVMDTIEPTMKESHELSKKLRDGVLNGTLSEKEAIELAKKISTLKEQVLEMKIVCISFMRKTLTKEQFDKLVELDKKMPYLNSPYNY